MANNVTKPKNDVRVFNQVLTKLGHRSIAHLINNVYQTTIISTNTDVDGRSNYPNLKAGCLVVGHTSAAPSTYAAFVCTVAPTSSTDAGTFVAMHA